MEHATISTVLLLGRPGSGKGTQTALLAKRLGWQTLSSGNIFREMRNSEGMLGERIRQTYDAGLIFPDWFPGYLLLDSFFKFDTDQGIICEGFSRTVEQAKLFDEFLEWLGRSYVVCNLDVSEEEAMRRQLERNKVDVRSDSTTPEKIKVRFDEYTAKTEPVLAFFKEKGTLIDIDGEQVSDAIAEELYQRIQSHIRALTPTV